MIYREIPKSVLRDVLKHKLDVSVDIETEGVNFTQKRIATLQLWVNDEGFFHDVRGGRPPHFDLFKEVCETREVTKIIQNAPFEGSFLAWHWDVWLRGLWDTKLMETIILGIENIPYYLLKGLTQEEKDARYYSKYGTGLKYIVARRKLGRMSKDLQTFFVNNYEGKITKAAINYGMKDVKVLPKIKALQIADIERMDLQELAALENRVAEITYKMQVFGVRHDTKRWEELADANEKELDKVMKKLPKAVENWNSPAQVKAYFATKGITIDSYNDLSSLKGQDKELDLFIDMRENYYKAATTYGHSWLTTEFISKAPKEIGPTVGPDGRVHPTFKQIVNTGRFSCSNPNMQQIPSNPTGNPLLGHKKCFIPAKGCKFVEVDFGGQELGLMAAGSREPGLLTPMQEGKDVHSIQAAKYFPQQWREGTEKGCAFPYQCECPKHKPLRHKAKRVTFGMPYGLSATGLADRIQVSKFEAKKLILSFARTLPVLNRWLERNAKQGEELRYIRTLPPFKRYRNLELEEPWRRRNQGKNTPIQGSGADMLKKAMVLVDEWIEKECKLIAGKITATQFIYKIVLVVHDSLVNEVPTGKAKKFAKVLKRCATQAADLITGVPGLIKAEPEIKNSL